LVALLLADLALGALGRAVPQIPLYFTGMRPRLCWAWARLLAGLATLDSALTVGFRGFLGLLERAAQLGTDGRRWLNPPPLPRRGADTARLTEARRRGEIA